MTPSYPFNAKEFAFIKEGAYFHVFWMRTNPLVPIDSTERDLGHAISRDLVHWTQLPPVLSIRPGKWDNFHIWASSIQKVGSTFYLYYTGVTKVPYGWTCYQRIGVATSTDLLNWTRYDAPVLSGAMIPWAYSDSSTFAGCQFRDPFVMPDPDMPGRTLLYYVGVPNVDHSQLIVGVAQSANMTGWSDLSPMWSTGAARFWGWCESPHLLKHGSLWYLFATTTSGHPLRFRTATSLTADSSAWSGQYSLFNMVGQDSIADAWFGSEALSIPGHDYFAVINSIDYSLEFYEILWGVPPNFTLVTPVITADAGDAPAAGLELAVIRPAGSGPGLMLRASLPGAMRARVELFDVSGRRVRSLQSGAFHGGETVIPWDGRLEGGALAPNGIYFASLDTPAGRRVARIPVTY